MIYDGDNVCLVDMDGSLFDYEGHLITSLKKMVLGPYEPDQELLEYIEIIENGMDLWVAEEKYPLLKEYMDRAKRTPDWWRLMPPLQNGHTFYKLAKEIGFHCAILTKGPKAHPQAWVEKLLCCQQHFGEDIDISIVTTKGRTYGKVLYDDYPEYMEAWLKWRPRGLGVMPVTKSNVNYTHPQVIKFDGNNIEEVKTALQAVYNRKPTEPL